MKGARQHYIAGTKHFDLSEYREALEEFKEAYRQKEDPVFLYNIAQCHRLIGGDNNLEALRFYKSYLNRAVNPPNRAEVEAKIRALQADLDQAQAAKATQATPAASIAQPATVVVPVAVVAAPPPRTPIYKKWWLWTIVGVAVVGVSVGVGVGVGSRTSAASSPFGGVTF